MSPGSPFSNVLGKDPGSSTFQNVESTQVSDTTTATGTRPPDNPTEGAPGVIGSAPGTTHESGQDETAAQTSTSGTYTAGT